jgi:hypothetical protein
MTPIAMLIRCMIYHSLLYHRLPLLLRSTLSKPFYNQHPRYNHSTSSDLLVVSVAELLLIVYEWAFVSLVCSTCQHQWIAGHGSCCRSTGRSLGNSLARPGVSGVVLDSRQEQAISVAVLTNGPQRSSRRSAAHRHQDCIRFAVSCWRIGCNRTRKAMGMCTHCL